MSDMISRQAAIAVADYTDYVGLSVEDVKKVTDEVVKGLKRLPSAQPEIVRCKYCKFWREHKYAKYAKGTKRYIPFCGLNAIYTKSDDFCSKGERRTDEQT